MALIKALLVQPFIVLVLTIQISTELSLTENFGSLKGCLYDNSSSSPRSIERSRISCAQRCLQDITCDSASYNGLTKSCFRHSEDIAHSYPFLKQGNDWSLIYKRVLMAPRILGYNVSNPIRYGLDVNVSCIVIGYPKPVLDLFMKGGATNAIVNNDKELQIFGYKTENDGTSYRFTAENQYGKTNYDFKLQGSY